LLEPSSRDTPNRNKRRRREGPTEPSPESLKAGTILEDDHVIMVSEVCIIREGTTTLTLRLVEEQELNPHYVRLEFANCPTEEGIARRAPREYSL
jgi:hypothetical protein